MMKRLLKIKTCPSSPTRWKVTYTNVGLFKRLVDFK